MKITQALMAIVAAVAFIGSAVATPPETTIEFDGGPMGKVTFDGTIHADKGLECNACHTEIFQMKKGSTEITMAAMNKGENCGTCHNGTQAFASSDTANCKNCHKK